MPLIPFRGRAGCSNAELDGKCSFHKGFKVETTTLASPKEKLEDGLKKVVQVKPRQVGKPLLLKRVRKERPERGVQMSKMTQWNEEQPT